MPGKPSHAIFTKKFRNEAGIKQLIQKAAGNPSRAPITTKLTAGAESVGRPAVIIERQFSQTVGHIGDDACKILRVVVDFTGRPITAYPVKKFLAAGGGVVAAVGASSTASARGPVNVVMEVYAKERAEHQARSDKACSPDSAIEWVIDFLVSPSCIAPDPHELMSRQELNQRIKNAVAEIAKRTGAVLDAITEENIRRDIIAIWGMGNRMD